MKVGQVYYDNEFCGTITQTYDNIFIFEYDETWFINPDSKSISLTMPKTQKKYVLIISKVNSLFAYFMFYLYI